MPVRSARAQALCCARAQRAGCGIAELEYGDLLDHIVLVIINRRYMNEKCNWILRVDITIGSGYR
eukprot:2720456-Pleurochrysis_carterae.AAC.4